LWIKRWRHVHKGDIKLSGIDWTASYDWDWPDVGAWNVAIGGTYYLHTTSPPFRVRRDWRAHAGHFPTDLAQVGGIPQNGVESLPRMRYRARLGWSNGPWSVTGFMDYQSHYYHTQTRHRTSLPMRYDRRLVPGGTFPCASAITAISSRRSTPSICRWVMTLAMIR